MDVNLINPFIEASCTILKSVANIDSTLGKVYIKSSPYDSDSLSIVIGIIGDLKGQVIFSMNRNAACKLASCMMMGMPIEQLDEISKSAISEAANMILGNAATILAMKKVIVDITPPALFEGNEMHVSTPKTRTICVPINFDTNEKIELNISTQE